MSWTDERVALLKKMWGEGKSAAEIAKELGGVTRNAVIGKAHRLKLSNRVSPIQQNTKKPVRAVEEIKPVIKKQEREAVPSRPIKVKAVSMVELREKMCRWPIGDPKDAAFHFCGCSTVAGLPYCGDHAKMAYQAATRSRILQAEDFERAAPDDESEAEEAKEAVA